MCATAFVAPTCMGPIPTHVEPRVCAHRRPAVADRRRASPMRSEQRLLNTAQRPATRRRRCLRMCTAHEPADGDAVPRDKDSLVAAICEALDAAAAPRATVSAIVPGLNPAIEDAFPYNETFLLDIVLDLALRRAGADGSKRVSLLFKSAGSAAAAAVYYDRTRDGGIHPRISLGSYFPRDKPVNDEPLVPAGGLGIFVNPVNSRGDPVLRDIMNILRTSSDACEWILFNPDFTGDRSALGVAEVSRRNEFLATFVDAFYLRNLFEVTRPTLKVAERGAVMRAFPSPWTVYALDNATGLYRSVATFDKLPQRHDITDALDIVPTRQVSVEEKLAKFLADDRSYLTTLLSLAVVASAMFFYLRVGHQL